MAWADELWKGRVIDAVHRDARNTLMDSVCPDKDQFYHSPCGYASAAQPQSSQPHTAHPHSISLPRHRYASAAQPDTFVNEEWVGTSRDTNSTKRRRPHPSTLTASRSRYRSLRH